MKNTIKILGIIALVAVIGFSMAACGGDDDGGGSGDSSEKSIKITGLGDFIGASYQLGLATTEDKLNTRDLVAYAVGTINSGTQTAQLFDYKTDAPWTGSGSYYVGVILSGRVSGTLVTISKKSFNSSVTTLSTDDFSGDFSVIPQPLNDINQ